MSFKVNEPTVLAIAKNNVAIAKIEKLSVSGGVPADITELKMQVESNTAKIDNFQSIVSDSFPNGDLILSENSVSKATYSPFDNSSSSSTNDVVGGAFTITKSIYITRLSIPRNHWMDDSVASRTFAMWSDNDHEFALWEYSIQKSSTTTGDYSLDIVPELLTPGSYRFGVSKLKGQLSASLNSPVQVFSDLFSNVYGVYSTDTFNSYPSSSTTSKGRFWLSGNFSYIYRNTNSTTQLVGNYITPDSGTLIVNGLLEVSTLKTYDFEANTAVIRDKLTLNGNPVLTGGFSLKKTYTIDAISTYDVFTDLKPLPTNSLGNFNLQLSTIPGSVSKLILSGIYSSSTATPFNSLVFKITNMFSLIANLPERAGSYPFELELHSVTIDALTPTDPITPIPYGSIPINISGKFLSSFGTFLGNSESIYNQSDFNFSVALSNSDTTAKLRITELNVYNIYNPSVPSIL